MAGKMASRKRKEKAFNLLAFFIVLILAALVLLPIWWIFRSSLMSTATLNEYPPSFIPHEWLWSNYSKALETFEYWTYFKNTFTIIIPAVTFGTITAIFCGYAFARLRFRGKKLIFNICVGTILLPGMVTLIPLYIFWTKGMGLGDTYWPLILPFLTGGGFFNIFLILFIQIWNDLLQQIIYINSMSKFTFAIALTNFTGSFGTNWPVALAATFMTILPGIVIYIFGQKSFVEGIVLTGMKN